MQTGWKVDRITKQEIFKSFTENMKRSETEKTDDRIKERTEWKQQGEKLRQTKVKKECDVESVSRRTYERVAMPTGLRLFRDFGKITVQTILGDGKWDGSGIDRSEGGEHGIRTDWDLYFLPAVLKVWRTGLRFSGGGRRNIPRKNKDEAQGYGHSTRPVRLSVDYFRLHVLSCDRTDIASSWL